MGIGNVAGGYANFIFGTGQECVSDAVSRAIKNRGSQNYFSAIYSGTKNGISDSYSSMMRKGGYIKSVKTDLKAVWDGVKNNKGIGKKLGALGKGFPLLMTALWVGSEAGNIIGAAKNEGIKSGVKETGRTAASLTLGTLFSSIAQGICKSKGKGGIWGMVASIGGYMLGSMLSGKLFGKSYAERKADTEQNAQAAQPAQPAPPAQPAQAPQVQQYAPFVNTNAVSNNNVPQNKNNVPFRGSMPSVQMPTFTAPVGNMFPPVECGMGMGMGMPMGMGMGMPMGVGMGMPMGMGMGSGNLLLNC